MKPNKFWTKTEKKLGLSLHYFETHGLDKAQEMKVLRALPADLLEELFDEVGGGCEYEFDISADQILRKASRNDFLRMDLIDALEEAIANEAADRDEGHIPASVRIAGNLEELINAVGNDVSPRDVRGLNKKLLSQLRSRAPKLSGKKQEQIFAEIAQEIGFAKCRQVIKLFDFTQ